MEGRQRQESDQCRLFQEKVAFFGKITAGVSHEMNNVMTVINEYNGLISDLSMLAEKNNSAIDVNRFAKLAGSVTSQIQRGKEIVQRLNRFSHTSDEPVSTFVVGEVLADIIELTRHYAKSKTFTVEPNLSEDKVNVVSDPFRLQQAVFICLQIFLENSIEVENCSVSWEKTGDGVDIAVKGGAVEENEDVKMQQEFLDELITELGGSIKTKIDSSEDSYCVISIPKEFKK